jgi:hypothetical protein
MYVNITAYYYKLLHNTIITKFLFILIQHLYATHVCILTDGKVSTPQDSDDDSIQPELDDDWPRDARDDPPKDDNDPSIPQNDVHQRPWHRTGRQQAEVKTDVSDGVKQNCAYFSFCYEIKLDASGNIT